MSNFKANRLNLFQMVGFFYLQQRKERLWLLPIKVVPYLSWGEADTFLFAFDGIPKGSIAAVSTIGLRKEKGLFMQGYNYMLMKITSDAIICYGKPF